MVNQLSLKELADILKMDEQAVHAAYSHTGALVDGCRVPLLLLPPDIQARCHAVSGPAPEPLPHVPPPVDDDLSQCAEAYAEASKYNRAVCDRRTAILAECAGLTGAALEEFVACKKKENPSEKISVQTICRWRKKQANYASNELLGQYGKRRGLSAVPDEPFYYFKRLYMTQGRASAQSCYRSTMGWAKKNGYDIDTMPKLGAFMLRLKNEIPKDAIYASRHGLAAANRKYGDFIVRNYDNVLSGEVWVSDHVQLDVAVWHTYEGRKKVVFPWITVMRDFKSGYWVGWYLHAESPNSDHIFTAFRRAAIAHGIPAGLYLDNGKDYRCRDFAGGRITKIKVALDRLKATSMCGQLGINVRYAIPYNAQSKPIERDFLNNKLWFSKHNPGYRGGNVVERPDDLNDKIKAGKIMTLEDVELLFGKYIKDVAMVLPVMSKKSYRCGKSPLNIWNAERNEAIRRGVVHTVSERSLAMFCCRVSKVMTVAKNGVYDSSIGSYYYDYWMSGCKGLKVYLRRDPLEIERAWVFDAETDTLIDSAVADTGASAWTRTDAQQKELDRAMARRQNSVKALKAFANPGAEVAAEEHIDNLAEYAAHLQSKSEPVTNVSDVTPPIQATKMDMDLADLSRRRKQDSPDLSAFGYDDFERPPEDEVFGLECHRYDDIRNANVG